MPKVQREDYSAAVARRFAARLAELRSAAGLTQSQLAERFGCPQPAIARWEKGGHLPTWDAVVRLAHTLGVTTDAFAAAPAEKTISEKNPKRD